MKLKNLKTFEGYKLEPHRNYDERNKYVEKKLLKILQNESYNGNLDLSGNKYPNIKDLYKLENLLTLNINNNKYLKSLTPLKECKKIFANNTNIEDLGFLKEIFILNMNNNKNIKSLGKYLKIIDVNLYLTNTNIKNLGILKYVKYLNLDNTKNIKSLYPLRYVDTIYMLNSNIKDISSIESPENVKLYLSTNTKIPKEQYKKFDYTLI